MTAATVMDIILRLTGCSGQATDAVSAYTQVKMEDAPTLFEKIQRQNVQIFGQVYQSTNGPNHGPVWKTQSFLLSGICTVILWRDCCGKGHFEKVQLKYGWETVPNWECLFVNREKGLFLSVYVDDLELAGKKQNINPTWKRLMKDVDLGEPASFLDHVYLGFTRRECQISKDIAQKCV